jgi:hypothetical protein
MPHPPLKLGFIGGGLNSAVGLTHRIAARMDGRFQHPELFVRQVYKQTKCDKYR